MFFLFPSMFSWNVFLLLSRSMSFWTLAGWGMDLNQEIRLTRLTVSSALFFFWTSKYVFHIYLCSSQEIRTAEWTTSILQKARIRFVSFQHFLCVLLFVAKIISSAVVFTSFEETNHFVCFCDLLTFVKRMIQRGWFWKYFWFGGITKRKKQAKQLGLWA